MLFWVIGLFGFSSLRHLLVLNGVIKSLCIFRFFCKIYLFSKAMQTIRATKINSIVNIKLSRSWYRWDQQYYTARKHFFLLKWHSLLKLLLFHYKVVWLHENPHIFGVSQSSFSYSFFPVSKIITPEQRNNVPGAFHTLWYKVYKTGNRHSENLQLLMSLDKRLQRI